MKIEKNENFIVITGFVLIIFVILFTLFRDKIFSNADDSSSQDTKSSSMKINIPTYETISATELNKKITISAERKDVVLLDIRVFAEYIQEHIIDSVNIELSEFPISPKIDATKTIVIIGSDSEDKNIAIAVEKIKQEHFKNVLVLAGGMDSWKQLIGSTINYGDPKSFVDQSKVSYLDAQELNKALSENVPVYIIDVRSSENFAKGHIAGSKNIPIEELEKRRGEISEKKIVVVGENELEEFQASVQIYDMLLITPFVMRTAIPGWQEKGFALVK